MTKIYRRDTLKEPIAKVPVKKRYRNVSMNFRVTPEEKEKINARIAISGLSKQDFFIHSCLYQNIQVQGNVKTFTAIRDELQNIYEIMDGNNDLAVFDPKKQEALHTILDMLDVFFKKKTY